MVVKYIVPMHITVEFKTLWFLVIPITGTSSALDLVRDQI